MTYSNGYIPLTALTPIENGLYLRADAANAWTHARDEITNTFGIAPRITQPDGAYRTYAQQVTQKRDAIAKGQPLNAATPGISQHGLGTAVDINNITQYNLTKLDTLMARYGFKRDFKWESWHYNYTPGTATASLQATPITKKWKTDMAAIVRKSNGRSYTLGAYGTMKHHASLKSRRAEEAITGPAVELDDGTFVELLMNRGLYEFVPNGHLTIMDTHAPGAEFIASTIREHN